MGASCFRAQRLHDDDGGGGAHHRRRSRQRSARHVTTDAHELPCGVCAARTRDRGALIKFSEGVRPTPHTHRVLADVTVFVCNLCEQLYRDDRDAFCRAIIAGRTGSLPTLPPPPPPPPYAAAAGAPPAYGAKTAWGASGTD
jgi:hypothetical protein